MNPGLVPTSVDTRVHSYLQQVLLKGYGDGFGTVDGAELHAGGVAAVSGRRLYRHVAAQTLQTLCYAVQAEVSVVLPRP